MQRICKSSLNSDLALFLLTLLLLTQISKAEETCTDLGACHICYTPQPNTQSGGTMTECSYVVCEETESYSYYDSSTNTTKTETRCVKYGTRYHNETQCLRSCCSAITVVDYFLVSEIDKCKEYFRLLPAVIVCGIVYGLALVGYTILYVAKNETCLGKFGEAIAIVFCFPCYLFRQRWWSTRHERRQRRQEEQAAASQENLLHFQWQTDTDERSEANAVLEDGHYLCPICSNNRVNTVTSRNTFYHLECISTWLTGNQQEPNTLENTPTQWVRYYCLGCRQRYCQIGVQILRHNRSEDLMRGIGNTLCPACSHNQQ